MASTGDSEHKHDPRNRPEHIEGGGRPEGREEHATVRDLVAVYPWLPPVFGLILVALGAWAFAEITEQVYQHGPLLALDERLLERIATLRTPVLVGVFGVVTYAGDSLVVLPVAAITGILLVRPMRSWTPLLLLAATSVGAYLTVFLIKLLIARPRPIPAPNAATEDSFAFPSGHSAHSAAVYLMIAILLLRLLHSWWGRTTVLAATLLIVVITGISRLVLGVHSPSDVLAGWILGASLTVLLVSLWRLSSYLPPLMTYLVRHARR
ncbi:undecaprenyl-diphosphatase [Halopolyspora algeriensis]|uniref:Undecaprenyl-diphosphatase n=1 Tax=Halopolyspora algeriensis TaxID=1500506 RepID=A0A368VHH8_9ACTN|nr:phosphatase PAP2 family protein [Halopolyspora algeriensis]RCW39114.1 undecaprenyl-diphosphatase [Halopolyspora algeriensis]TQM56588.1 undecaprenyl-diphosphatase [Halopolyspora algeriensis]